MNAVRSRSLALALALLAAPALAGQAPAVLPPAQVEVGELIRDLQRTHAPGDSMELVWWMPKEYMEVSMAQSGSVDPKTAKEFTDLFAKYTVVAVVRGRIGALGVDGYESEADLRAKLRIEDATGKAHAPIAADKVDRKLSLLISILRPMFKQLIGEMGENVQVFVFPGQVAGRRLAEPLSTGQFLIMLGDTTHRFRLPLGSLLVPRQDAATGERFPGSFNFNPYTGAALQPAQR